MNFLPEILPLHGIYKGSKILKLIDYISIQNALLIKYCFDDELPKPLKDCFKKKKSNSQLACNLLGFKKLHFYP